MFSCIKGNIDGKHDVVGFDVAIISPEFTGSSSTSNGCPPAAVYDNTRILSCATVVQVIGYTCHYDITILQLLIRLKMCRGAINTIQSLIRLKICERIENAGQSSPRGSCVTALLDRIVHIK